MTYQKESKQRNKELSPEEQIKIRYGGYKSFLRRHEKKHILIEDIDERVHNEEIKKIQKVQEQEKRMKNLEIKLKEKTGKFFIIIGFVLFILFLVFMFTMQWYGFEFAY